MSRGESKIIGRRIANAWLSSVISISLVLLLVAVASLLLVNAGRVSDYLKENLTVSVLMNQDVSEEETAVFVKRISTRPYVRTAEIISKEQGMSEMEELLGRDFLDVFESSPIPVSVDMTVMPPYVQVDSLDVIRAELLASNLVDEVTYQRNLVDALNANLRKISIVIGVFVILMLFISYILIGNTVRLNVDARRFTIHTMKMVGATRSFIRAPFMTQSLFEGLVSAMIAVISLLGMLFMVKRNFPPFFEIFSLDLLLVVIGIVLLSGVAICMISTFFVVNKLVGLNRADLYY